MRLYWRDWKMNRPEHDGVNFFTGTEVEHTPAYGMRTLFVIGVHPNAKVYEQLEDGITHIYFGANMSFPNLKANDGAEWAKWETMIYQDRKSTRLNSSH